MLPGAGSRGAHPRPRPREPAAHRSRARRRRGATSRRRRPRRWRRGREGDERDLVARPRAADRARVRAAGARRARPRRRCARGRADRRRAHRRAPVRPLGPEAHVTENRLARETSPYLLQHAHNPVDWYPWGEEAFARARDEDKPILLSVGYSACHWCHVMEHESFENPEIAALMNRHFVSVKVDREERPDVDQIYMQAVQSMTGHGGWPMTCFLTPHGEPFYGGTYFPPVERHGLPAFPRLLQALADAWANRRGEVTASARQLGETLAQADRLRSSTQLLTDEILFGAFQALSAQFDEKEGGLGGAPKFPQPMLWEFVLRFWRRAKNARARQMAHTTLTMMARGGIYDQVGGGFHRYSVDAHWLVPHFEQMLYDKVLASWNGPACRAFGEAGRALGRPDYVAAAVKNADFVLREMRRDGRLLRTWKAGGAKLKGYLEDYAMVAAALVDVYEATFDRRWLDEARGLAEDMVRLFWDERLEGFYDTGVDHERLIVSPRNLFDKAVPCGSSVAIETLFRLAILTGESRYEATAVRALRPMADLMARHASGFGRFLCALDFHLGPVVEIALLAPERGDGIQALAAEVFGRYLPNRVVTGSIAGDPRGAEGIPLLQGREAIGGKPTAYVCRNYACELPVTDRESLARQLDAS